MGRLAIMSGVSPNGPELGKNLSPKINCGRNLQTKTIKIDSHSDTTLSQNSSLGITYLAVLDAFCALSISREELLRQETSK